MKSPRDMIRALACVLAGAIMSCTLVAQPILSSADSGATPGGFAAGAFGALGLGSSSTANEPFAKWGPFAIRPRFDYRLTYADGLQLSLGRPVSTYIDTITAGLTIEVGQHWRLDYAPSWTSYSHSGFRESVGQSFSLDGQFVNANWSMNVSQRYSLTDSPMVQTARQTKQESSQTQVGGMWRLGRSTTFLVSAEQKLAFFEGLADTYEWSLSPDLGHQFLSGFNVGMSVPVGYVLMYRSSDMTYTRPSLRATWPATRKLSFNVVIGMDRWDYVAANRPSRQGLFYSSTAAYQPFSQTLLSLTASRSLEAAQFHDQMSQTEKFTIKLRQRLLGHFHLDLSADRQESAYLDGLLGGALARKDAFSSYEARVSATILRRITTAVFYRLSENSSDIPGYGFDNNQIGFQAGCRY